MDWRRNLLAQDTISRVEMADAGNCAELAERLKADPAWEEDATTGTWAKRDPEFILNKMSAYRRLDAEIADAERVLRDMVARINVELPRQADGLPMAYAPDGHQYTAMRVAKPCAREATEEWYRVLRADTEYDACKVGAVLFWRIRPEIKGFVDMTGVLQWSVYGRFRFVQEEMINQKAMHHAP